MTKIPELRRRLLHTLGLLAVYRIGVFVTTPGVNAAVMSKIVSQSSGTFLGLFNMFSGGALEKMSIFALGIMPWRWHGRPGRSSMRAATRPQAGRWTDPVNRDLR